MPVRVFKRLMTQRLKPVGVKANPVVHYADDPIIGHRDQVAIYDSHDSFIPMPEQLRTRDEMVAWMTEELPKLTAALPKSGG
jgi:hypothetical protein